jgi:hypothetical protein
MESSRDCGWRHDAGRFVQFCACRKPTITICRAMLVLPSNKLGVILRRIGGLRPPFLI